MNSPIEKITPPTSKEPDKKKEKGKEVDLTKSRYFDFLRKNKKRPPNDSETSNDITGEKPGNDTNEMSRRKFLQRSAAATASLMADKIIPDLASNAYAKYLIKPYAIISELPPPLPPPPLSQIIESYKNGEVPLCEINRCLWERFENQGLSIPQHNFSERYYGQPNLLFPYASSKPIGFSIRTDEFSSLMSKNNHNDLYLTPNNHLNGYDINEIKRFNLRKIPNVLKMANEKKYQNLFKDNHLLNSTIKKLNEINNELQKTIWQIRPFFFGTSDQDNDTNLNAKRSFLRAVAIKEELKKIYKEDLFQNTSHAIIGLDDVYATIPNSFVEKNNLYNEEGEDPNRKWKRVYDRSAFLEIGLTTAYNLQGSATFCCNGQHKKVNQVCFNFFNFQEKGIQKYQSSDGKNINHSSHVAVAVAGKKVEFILPLIHLTETRAKIIYFVTSHILRSLTIQSNNKADQKIAIKNLFLKATKLPDP